MSGCAVLPKRARFTRVLDSARKPIGAPPAVTTDDSELLDAYSKTVAAVVDSVAPSVVNIRVVTGERGPGSGSGFLITNDGFILTNSHVVHGARELEVTLHDAHRCRAQLVGTDPDTDLAVIRIHESGLSKVRLADSARHQRPMPGRRNHLVQARGSL